MSATSVLDDEFARKLSKYFDELSSKFSSSSRSDHAAAEESIAQLYQLLGKEKPRIFWCESPFQMVLMSAVLREGAGRDLKFFNTAELCSDKVFPRLWKRIDAQVDDSDRAEMHQASKIRVDASWISRLPIPMAKQFTAKPSAWTPLVFSVRALASQANKELQGLLDEYFARQPNYKELKAQYQSTRQNFGGDSSRQISAHLTQLVIQGIALPFERMNFSRDDLLRFALESVTGNSQAAFEQFCPKEDREKFRLFFSVFTANSLMWHTRWGLDLLPFYRFLFEQIPSLPVGPTNKRRIRTLIDLASEGLCYIFYEGYVFACESPTRLSLDENARLHSEFGPALSSLDGYALYAWHGSTVPRWIIEQPEKITIPAIMKEFNAEIRRVMIDRYGIEKFIKGSGAQQIQRDECGVLYKKEFDNDEPLVMVKVKNSSKEPDGSYKYYFLRVPPDTKTAREAVAWTFDMQENDYKPESQT